LYGVIKTNSTGIQISGVGNCDFYCLQVPILMIINSDIM